VSNGYDVVSIQFEIDRLNVLWYYLNYINKKTPEDTEESYQDIHVLMKSLISAELSILEKEISRHNNNGTETEAQWASRQEAISHKKELLEKFYVEHEDFVYKNTDYCNECNH
jgi:hypothetical protein